MEWISSYGLVMESWLSFMRGHIVSIPTAANENEIKASWTIILGVLNDGRGVTFSICSIWNMGSSTLGTRFGVVLALVLSAFRFSFKFFVSSLFSRLGYLSLSVSAPFSSGESMQCLIFCLSFELLGLDFIFITLLWPPSESDIGGKNSLPPSVFASGVGG